MVGNGGVARRLVAAVASVSLLAGLMPVPALAEVAEELQAARDVGAPEVAEGPGDGVPEAAAEESGPVVLDVADGGPGDGARGVVEGGGTLEVVEDDGAQGVVKDSGEGVRDIGDGDSGDGGLEVVGDVVTLGDTAEEPVVASAQAQTTGTIGSASYAFDDSTGVLQVSGGSFTLGAWNGVFGSSIQKSSVKAVVFAGTKVTDSTRSMFSGFVNLTTVDASGLDVSAVTNMLSMFYCCYKLASLDLSGWDTSAVTDMTSMFYNCYALASLDLSGWNTASVTNMSSMFQNCSSLASLDLSGWDTGAVTNMSSMFFGCSKLASLVGTSGWNTASVRDMSSMFRSCSSLASLDLSGWQTGAVTGMSSMFRGCKKLASLGLSGWDTRVVTDMDYMFQNCSSLASLDLSGWKTARVEVMYSMFDGCSSLVTVWVGDGWSTEEVTSSSSGSMFSGCTKITGGAGTEYNSSYMDKTYARVDGGEGEPGYFTLASGHIGTSPYLYRDGALRVYTGSFTRAQWDAEVDKIGRSGVASVAFAGAAVTGDARDMFSGFRGLTTVDASGLDVSQVTDMSAMFYGCSKLASLDASGWNTAGATGMSAMFYGCSKLASLDVSGWDTAGVTSMFSMFEGCSSLVSLDVSGWKTGSVGAMYAMFQGCSKLESLDVSGWDTSSAWNMSAMFHGCSSLASLDVSGWKTARVEDMSAMFYGCSKLVSLDLSGWDTKNAEFMFDMFGGCSSLKTVWVGDDWSTARATYPVADYEDHMFYGCESLVGGAGTKWDAGNPIDKTYARVDGGAGNPGYLTLASGRIGTSPYSFTGGVLCVGAGSFTIGDWNAVIDGRTLRPSIRSVVIAAGASITGSAERMFENLNVSTSLDVSGLDVSGVTNMSYMFRNCSSLASLDLSGWDTGKATTMYYMFEDCYALASLDGLSGWNMASARSFNSMFMHCHSLTSLDLSGWNTAGITNMPYMFQDCSSLKTVWVGTGWDMSHVESSGQMFGGCESLVGGAGTKWDAGHMNGDYARVDGIEGVPGYLTLASGHIGSSPYSFAGGTLFVGAGGFTKADWDAEFATNIDRLGVTSAVFRGARIKGDASAMFSGFDGLASVDASGLDVSAVTDMSGMFQGCANLASLDLSGWKTGKVGAMPRMFFGCSSLESLDLSGWDTSDVTVVSYMFCGCTKLVSLDLSGWDTAGIEYMDAMFSGCSSLETLDLFGWDTAGVVDMSCMFQDCSSLAALDLSGWDTAGVADVSCMFSGCSSLKTVWVAGGWNANQVQTSIDMFAGCGSLVGGAGTKWDAAHTDKTYARVDGKGTPGYLTMRCAGHIGTSPYSFVDGVLRVGAGSFTKDDWDAELDTNIDRPSVTSATFAGAAVTGKAWLMFSGFSGLTTVDASGLDVSAVTDMSSMFDGCSKLVSIDGLSGWDTASVTDMSSMFKNCSSLVSLDLSKWKTGNVNYMSSMFNCCSSLTSLNVSGWDTGSVTDMSSMFPGCSSLASLVGTSGWNTASVTNMAYMFLGCSSLASLDTSGWNTANVSNFNTTFSGCSSLASLDLSGWNTANVSNFNMTFSGCSSLKTVWVGENWSTQNVLFNAQNMFAGCESLVGGAGTKWDATRTDKTYAHADGGTENPGYLTLASGRIGTSPYSYVDGVLRVGVGSFTKSEWESVVFGRIGRTGIKEVVFAGAAITGNATSMFGYFNDLVSVDASGLDVSQVTEMTDMFRGCSSLVSLDLSGWDIGNTKYMSSMFYGCSSLASLVGTSGWDTSSVTNMSYMFYGCSSLASLDASGWDTSSVTKMYDMFQNCSSLASLDLSGWDTGNVTSMYCMFNGCSSLKTVWVGEDWSTEKVGSYDYSYMFYGCESLVGGAGTKWDAGHINGDYAHADGGEGDPGYFCFTGKPVFRGCYLVLSGEIGVTFTLEASSQLVADGARVGFSVGGREVAEAPLSGFETDEGGRYLLRCGVTSLEMAGDVVVTLRWGEEPEKSVTASYSVEDYAHYIVDHPEDYNEKEVRLAKAINDYGYYVQPWLSEQNGFTLGEGGDYAKMEEAYAKKYSYDEIKQSVDKYKIQKTLGNSGVKVSYQLHLDSATGISVRVRPDPKNTIKIDRSKLSGTLEGDGASGDAVVTGPQQSDGSYVVRLDGIPAHRLADWFRVSGETNKDVFSAGVCALSYVRTVYWTSGYNNAAKDAMAALLEYYDATVNYRDSEGVTA